MKKIDIFACNNGLGHTKRTIILANYLSDFFKIVLHSNKAKAKKFFIKKKITVKNFVHRDLSQNYSIQWIKKYKKTKFDLIISDNLPEVCFLNGKVIIYANFLWHEIIKKFNRKTKKLIIDKINEKKTIIIGNYLFQNLNGNYNKKKIGFIGRKKLIKKNNIKNILISLGTANINNIKGKIINDILFLLENKISSNFNFYIDKAFIKYFKKFKNVYEASYNENNLKKVDLCICKPGFGIITDCLKYGIPIFSIDYNFNPEFKNNNKIIQKNNLGFVYKNFRSIQLNKIKKINLKKFQKEYKKIQWSGEIKIRKIIKNNLF